MDPVSAISVAGNTIQFLGLAYTVSPRINKYCRSTAEIPPIFRELSIQISLIADLCRKLETDTLVNSEQRLDHVLKGCIRNLETLDTLVSKVTPAIDCGVYCAAEGDDNGFPALHIDHVDPFDWSWSSPIV